MVLSAIASSSGLPGLFHVVCPASPASNTNSRTPTCGGQHCPNFPGVVTALTGESDNIHSIFNHEVSSKSEG
jgi:hypothetical protein